MEIVRLLQTELEHYEKVEGEPLSLEGKANKLSQMIRSNLPAAMQGMVVVPLFCGFDLRKGEGRLYKYDVTGGKYEEADYATTGSGGVHARNWIKAGFRQGLAKEEAVDLGLLALFQAADEDSATGGPDLVRHIFPTVAVIDVDGYVKLADGDVEQRSIDLLGSGRSAL
jgi:proteasome beta subunit